MAADRARNPGSGACPATTASQEGCQRSEVAETPAEGPRRRSARSRAGVSGAARGTATRAARGSARARCRVGVGRRPAVLAAAAAGAAGGPRMPVGGRAPRRLDGRLTRRRPLPADATVALAALWRSPDATSTRPGSLPRAGFARCSRRLQRGQAEGDECRVLRLPAGSNWLSAQYDGAHFPRWLSICPTKHVCQFSSQRHAPARNVNPQVDSHVGLLAVSHRRRRRRRCDLCPTSVSCATES